MHADSPSETWICTVHVHAACCMHCHSAYIHYVHSNYYILQTSAASLTTETAISHENVSLLCLVKTAGTVGLGIHRIDPELEILSLALVLAFVSILYKVCKPPVFSTTHDARRVYSANKGAGGAPSSLVRATRQGYKVQ